MRERNLGLVSPPEGNQAPSLSQTRVTLLERHAECPPPSGSVPVVSEGILEPTVSLGNSSARADQCVGRVREPRLRLLQDPLSQLESPGIARAADRFRQVDC